MRFIEVNCDLLNILSCILLWIIHIDGGSGMVGANKSVFHFQRLPAQVQVPCHSVARCCRLVLAASAREMLSASSVGP